MKSKSEILAQHPFSIWEDKKGFWFTRFRDNDGKVKLKRAKTRKDIEKLIIDDYTEKSLTIEDLYNLWISEKLDREEISAITADRYQDDFRRFFSNIKGRPLIKITELELQDFVMEQTMKNHLSIKGFAGLRIICYGIFKYARRKRLSDIDIVRVFDDLDLSRKSLRSRKKQAKEEVFDSDECEKITEYLKKKNKPIELGLLFLFATGLRVGELAALKWSECENGFIYICRTEVKIPVSKGKYDYVIRDYPKTEAGIRYVPIPDKYEWILEKMKAMNPSGEYVFEDKKGRIKTFMFRKHLVTACDNIGIPRRSPHKIRKTYASILMDGGVPDKMITEMMGHTSIGITTAYYARHRRQKYEEKQILNSVSGL